MKAVAAYLARYRGQTRVHTASDLLAYLEWRRERGVDALKATRVQIQLYVRWVQKVLHVQPSTVSRGMSVVAGFCRTCVIDLVQAQSPADYVRRPNVPSGSSMRGLSHLQLEPLLSAARTSTNLNAFALVTMLGLLGWRVFEASGASITDLGEQHAKVHGKGGKAVLTPLPSAVQCAIERRHRPHRRADPAQPARSKDGPTRSQPPTQTPGRRCWSEAAQDAPAHAAAHVHDDNAGRRC